MFSRSVFPVLLLLFGIACTTHDIKKTDKQTAMAKACEKCDRTVSEMQWLSELIDKSANDMQFQGPIYAITETDRTLFIHQAYIRSCLGCVIYDCDGNSIDIQSVDMQEIAGAMNDSNLIYSPL